MRLIKIIGPYLERRKHLQRILVEQAVSLTGGPDVDHFFCDDPRNKTTFLAIGFDKKKCAYADLDQLYRSANDIEKSMLNIDFKFNVEHVMLSVNIWLAHIKNGKYDEWQRLINNLVYLADCLLFVDNPPQGIKSIDDIFAVDFKKLIELASFMVKEIGSSKSQRMLAIRNNGEYLVARDELAYLLDDNSLAEVYREFTVAHGKALPEASLENFMPISTVKIPAYSSPLKPKKTQPVIEQPLKEQPLNAQPEITTIKPVAAAAVAKRSYADVITQPVKPPVKQNTAAPLTWLRNTKTPGDKDADAYRLFGTKRKGIKNTGKYSQEGDCPPDKIKSSANRIAYQKG